MRAWKRKSFAAITAFFLCAHAHAALDLQSLHWDRLQPDIQNQLSRLLDNAQENPWMWDGFRSSSFLHYPQYYFEQALNAEERLQLLATLIKLRSEGLLEYVRTIIWAGGKGGALLFYPTLSQEALQSRLREKGYVSRFGAAGDGWGLRSPRKGAQLHFRGSGERVNVHIDLHNPAIERRKDYSPLALIQQIVTHVVLDLFERDDTHGPVEINEALRSQGLDLFVIQNP